MEVHKSYKIGDNNARKAPSGRNEAHTARHGQGRFTFVNTSNPKKPKDRSVQRVIRKHVMRDIGHARRRNGNYGRQNLLQIPTFLLSEDASNDFMNQLSEISNAGPVIPAPMVFEATPDSRPSNSPVSEAEAASDSASVQVKEDQGLLAACKLSPFTSPSKAFSDPFLSYPIEMDSRAHWLIINIFDDRHANFQPFRDIWFPLALSDGAAFHQLLSNSALHITSLRPIDRQREAFEALSHHAVALMCVQNRLADPTVAISDGIIASIIGFACHDHMTSNFETWRVHMNGLKKIVALRGGPDALNENRLLRLILTWVDVIGSCAQDAAPVFPLPDSFSSGLPLFDSASGFPPLVKRVCNRWRQDFPRASEISFIFEDLSLAIEYLALEAKINPLRVWSDYGIVGFWLMPLIHRLLSLLSLNGTTEHEPSHDLEHIWRLGMILFLADIRRKAGFAPMLTRIPLMHLKAHIENLFLLPDDHCVRKFWELQLWVLAYASMEATYDPAYRKWFVSHLAAAIMKYCGGSWSVAERCLKAMPWIDIVHSTKLDQLRNDISARIFICTK
ncbi:hypothetical protein L228DRAFT_284902 [Xylona heveae TC161]|uniref:Fungal-specific transcription factor domain-containing protein n=1 Tax=Xylona heveae (strain CBS 132557 / TC161) TaxID=1328760 RepID=A0A165AAC1_XYLHT|nr:hypothetical protein L228DRAFT_284902 [Xylona heveae TC161]KZF20166.1 hypothetical protein L228DRAFT_284902 [Xylona heveae TC161]